MTTMSHELARIPRAPSALATFAQADLVEAFLSGRKPTTPLAYRNYLEAFARFVGMPAPGPAVELLISGTAGQANAAALAYRAHLLSRRLAPATVARRLAALRSMIKLARTVGRVAWA